MPYLKKQSSIISDRYTEYVISNYEIQDPHISEVDIYYPKQLDDILTDDNWSVGLIVGSSGSGKSSILNHLGTSNTPQISEDLPIVSQFKDISCEDACKLLTSVGLSSVPSWIRPVRYLSNGERYRADLAYKIHHTKSDVVFIDEFTSVINRDCAKSTSHSLSKFASRYNKKFVIASCHYDIIPWLNPAWIFSCDNGVFERRDCLRQRPDIPLQVSRVESSTWDLFKKHHYLTEKVNKSCKFFLFSLQDQPVCLIAVINRPAKGLKNAMAISRAVVLPDFQGLGIGRSCIEYCASAFIHKGYRMFIKTVNPSLGEYMSTSNDWRPTSKNGKYRSDVIHNNSVDRKYKNAVSRVSYCYEYVGIPCPDIDHLTLPIKQMRRDTQK